MGVKTPKTSFMQRVPGEETTKHPRPTEPCADGVPARPNHVRSCDGFKDVVDGLAARGCCLVVLQETWEVSPEVAREEGQWGAGVAHRLRRKARTRARPGSRPRTWSGRFRQLWAYCPAASSSPGLGPDANAVLRPRGTWGVWSSGSRFHGQRRPCCRSV